MRSLDSALDMFMTSLKIRQNLLGNTHKDVATILYNIATVQLSQGDEDEALRTFHETLKIERLALSNNDQGDIIITLRHIGQIHKSQGNLNDALVYLEEALGVQSQIGANDVMTGEILNQMGNIYLEQRETRRAMDWYSCALRIFRQAGRPDSDLVIEDYERRYTNFPEAAAAA